MALGAVLVLLLSPTSLLARQPDLGTLSQQAAAVAREIDALDKEAAVASEAYNLVKVDLDAITEKVDQTQKRLYDIRQSLRERRDLLNARAATMYKNGRTSMIEVLLRTKDFSEFLERADYVSRVARSDADLIERIKTTRDSVEALERGLAEERRQQQALVSQAQGKKSEVERKLGERRALLSSLNKDIQQQLAAQQRITQADTAALNKQAEEALVNAPDGGLAKTAMRYLGVPYHWAGEGPGKCPTGEHRICFDCSGLTQYVYKLYGIDIPHNAAMQFNRGIHVTLQQARPGDCVYFGSPPHHCGMYLGNDMFIHAPQTGDVVKVTKLSSRSDTEGFCRFSK